MDKAGEDIIDKAAAAGGILDESIGTKPEKVAPVYKVIGDSKLPVSKAMGKLWSSRKDQATAKRKSKNIERSWDEAIKYYKHDQLSHRHESDADVSGNDANAADINRRHSETENIVYANVNALVPMLYAKNPRCEITAEDEEDQELARTLELLLNKLSTRRKEPGLNLKGKAKRAVVMASLTNRAYFEVGYVTKQNSSEQAVANLQALAKKLETAKDAKEIAEIEGQLTALEKSTDMLLPSGPWVKFRHPKHVLVDPDAIEDDLSDANYIMICDFMPTEYLKATFMTKKEGENAAEFSLIYQPTHVMKLGAKQDEGVDEKSMSIFSQNGAASYGYADEEAFARAQRTKVWYVWDKITRRLYLFNDADWTWPIWVWDDPYKLDRFFPLIPLSFYTDPEGGEAKGEVTYYLDQQDAINEINSEEKRARLWVRRNVVYNADVVTQEQVQAFLRGTKEENAIGVKGLPEGSKLNDHIYSVPPPSVQFMQLFNKEGKLAAIDRISGTNEALRGGQFRTNTTNDAVQAYTANQSTRLDEKIDAIEDALGQVYWCIGQMCLQNMDMETVAGIIGEARAQAWRNMSAQEISDTFEITIVGGSTVKPTSAAKKDEALKVGQVLGQFAKATPVAGLVMMKVFERAFDDVVITEEDWKLMRQTVEAQLMPQGAGGAGGDAGMQTEQLLQAVDALPPEAKKALGDILARGVPVAEALPRVLELAQNKETANAQ